MLEVDFTVKQCKPLKHAMCSMRSTTLTLERMIQFSRMESCGQWLCNAGDGFRPCP